MIQRLYLWLRARLGEYAWERWCERTRQWTLGAFVGRYGSPAAALPAAAAAMYHLNRWAYHRHCPESAVIYSLKTRFVHLLYDLGMCTDVSIKEQHLPCWGDYYEPPCVFPDHPKGCHCSCPRCGGTGVYRTYQLFRFVFRVGTRHYVWHQPGQFVTWPVELTEPDVGEYKGRGPDPLPEEEPIYPAMHLVSWVLGVPPDQWPLDPDDQRRIREVVYGTLRPLRRLVMLENQVMNACWSNGPLWTLRCYWWKWQLKRQIWRLKWRRVRRTIGRESRLMWDDDEIPF